MNYFSKKFKVCQWKLYLLFISCYFSKQLTLYTLDTKIWKNILSSYESKKNIWICRQLKYYQLRIRSEIGISLEIILNVFKCLTVSLSIEILILATMPLSFIQLASSVNLLCCQMCTFYCPLRKKRCTLLPEGTDVHIWKHIHQKDWTLYLSLY